MIEPISIKIGEIVICISLEGFEDKLNLIEFYNQFLASHEAADITLTVKYENLPDLTFWEEVFDSGGIWRLWRRSEDYALSFDTPVLQPNRFQVVLLDPSLKNGTIFIRKELSGKKGITLTQNLFEFLVVNYLSNHTGVMLHACAVKDGDSGRLFSGVSGAGKSTISLLWAKQDGVLVLSDDRSILRKQDSRFWIYGTPWHGTAGFGSPQVVPLDQIYILRHASQNQVKLLTPTEAATSLFVRSFPTFWNQTGMGYTLDLLAELSQSVPCYELSFRPELEVVDFIRCLS